MEIPGLTDREISMLVKFADRVYARTDCSCNFNARNGRLYFFLRSPEQGIALPPAIVSFRNSVGEFDFSVLDRLDDICVLIQEGRKPFHHKLKLLEWMKNAEKSAEASRENREYDTLARITLEHFRRTKNRHGMGRKFRPSILVNGLKGVN